MTNWNASYKERLSIRDDHHLDRKHFQHGRGCSGFKPPDSYQKAISQYPIVRRRGSCHRSPWKDGARYRRGTKLYPRDRSIGRYFRQGVSVYGAYLVCSRTIREYLVNTMRPLIFSTALPPFQIAWTSFIWEQLPSFTKERENLLAYSRLLAEALTGKGGEISQKPHHPFHCGRGEDCVRKAEELQRKGFYCLPVRPPTVPKGTSRIRFSLTANLTIKIFIN